MASKYPWETTTDHEAYEDKLMDKLRGANEIIEEPVDLAQVQKAIHYAKKYHAEQKQSADEPHYTRPLAIAYMTANHCLTTEAIVVAILHDVVANTDLTLAIVAQEFGPIIAEQIDAFNKLSIDYTPASIETVKRMFEERDTDLLVIKLVSNLYDLRTSSSQPMWQRKEAALQSLENYLPLVAYMELREIEEELVALCQNILNPGQDEQNFALSARFGFTALEFLRI